MKRDESLDILRIISCIAVIAIHCVGWTYLVAAPGDYYAIADKMWKALHFAVPCFIMMTGAFTLSNPANCEYSYYKKVWKRIVLPTLIFSLFYTIYTVVIKTVTGDSVGSAIADSMLLWLSGDPFGHMWYMYMLIGFYAVVPFLCRAMIRLSDMQKWLLGAIWLIIGFILSYKFGELIWPLKFTQYLGYFILGDCIYRRYREKKSSRIAVSAFCIFIVLSIFRVFELIQVDNVAITRALYGHERMNVLIIISAIALFTGFANLNMHTGTFGKKIAYNSFFIYLIHGGVVSVLGNVWESVLGLEFGNPWVVVPVYTLLVGAISYSIAEILNSVMNKLGAAK